MTTQWKQFDDDVDEILQLTAKGQAERKLQTLTTIISTIAVERFGEEEKKDHKTTYTPNRRAVEIHKIRGEMKALKIQYKEATAEKRNGLAQLMCILRKKIIVLRRAEWHRRRHRKRVRKRANFINNPYKFTKQLLEKSTVGNWSALRMN